MNHSCSEYKKGCGFSKGRQDTPTPDWQENRPLDDLFRFHTNGYVSCSHYSSRSRIGILIVPDYVWIL